MGYAVGVLLALIVCTFARSVGFDRDRAFYPTVLIVTATYYVLFSVMGGSTRALVLELAVMSAFTLAAVAGFKRNSWLLVAAFAGHAVFDFFHTRIMNNPGVPEWWPAFCLSFDVGMAAFLAWLRLTRLDPGTIPDRRVLSKERNKNADPMDRAHLRVHSQ